MREDQPVELPKIRCGAYPCVERQGLIWIYFAKNGEAPSGSEAEPPRLPVFGDDVAPALKIMLPFPCSTDHAAFGLMDPTHARLRPHLVWFKKDPTKLRPKRRRSSRASSAGRMVRHALPPQNIAYKVLGQNVFDRDLLPSAGLRIEEIRGRTSRRRRADAAITPVDSENTEVHQFFWSAWLGEAAAAAARAPDDGVSRPGPWSSWCASARGSRRSRS